jgi:hypothetical protein
MVDKDFSEDHVQDEIDFYQSIKKEKVSKQIIFMPLEHILPFSNFMDFSCVLGLFKIESLTIFEHADRWEKKHLNFLGRFLVGMEMFLFLNDVWKLAFKLLCILLVVIFVISCVIVIIASICNFENMLK